MRNVRRVPFIVVSISNAALLFFTSLLYFYHIQQSDAYHKIHPVIVLYVIIGLEMVIAIPCLVYYIGEGLISLVQHCILLCFYA